MAKAKMSLKSSVSILATVATLMSLKGVTAEDTVDFSQKDGEGLFSATKMTYAPDPILVDGTANI